MKNWRHFYRHGFVCVVQQDNDTKEYIGHIGLKKEDKFYKSIFAKVANHKLYKMLNEFKFNNASLDNEEIWWLSIKPMVSYDRQKVINVLKEITDELAKKPEDKKTKPRGYQFL